jgi:pilus assembly protein Flp/PilA
LVGREHGVALWGFHNVLLSLPPGYRNIQRREPYMHLGVSLLYKGMLNVILQEEGQDLVEYALVVALIALAATAGMGSLATAINGAFTALSTTLTSSI